MLGKEKMPNTGVIKTDVYINNLKNQQKFLQKFKAFPDKTRKATYRDLLALPLNSTHFQQLSKPYKILPQHGLNKQVGFLTNALSKLYPELQNQLLPSVIHPFVKLFQEDCLFAFQCSLAFLLNWIHPVIVDLPNPSKKIMQIFQQQLPQLNAKVNSFDYPISSIISPMFIATLTDVLNRQDWLQIFDYLVTNPFSPEMYITIGLALVKSIQDRLLRLSSIEQISVSLRKQKNVPMTAVIQLAKQLQVKYEKQLKEIYQKSMFPITHGRYPVFKFINAPIKLMSNYYVESEEQDLADMESKFKQLQQFMQKGLKQNKVSNSKEIQQNYQLIFAQIQDYSEQVKKQHMSKIKILEQMEFKNDGKQGKNNSKKIDDHLSRIERKAKFQKEIEDLKDKEQSAMMMKERVLDKMKDQLKSKKIELCEENRRMRGIV